MENSIKMDDLGVPPFKQTPSKIEVIGVLGITQKNELFLNPPIYDMYNP